MGVVPKEYAIYTVWNFLRIERNCEWVFSRLRLSSTTSTLEAIARVMRRVVRRRRKDTIIYVQIKSNIE